MQREEPRVEPEAAREQDPANGETGSERATPPIDEDVAGSVNAAVPDIEEDEARMKSLKSRSTRS